MTAYEPTWPARLQRAASRALLGLPVPVRRLAAGRPHVVDGDPLDPDIAVGLRILSRTAGPGLEERPVEDARRVLAEESWMFAGPPTPVGSVRDLSIPGPGGDVPARLYVPVRSRALGDRPLGLLLWFHGGGWVLGDLDTHDAVCRALCAGAEVAVLSVGYRLAPEHRFPAAVEDCVAAFRWSHSHATELGVDPARVAVGGDSAGGNLSAVVAQVTTQDGGPAPAFQLLVVPATDFTVDRPSKALFATGYFLTTASMDWYEAQYLGSADRSDPRVSPLLGSLAGLPPAYVAVGGFDPLRDEGIAYADALRAAGVRVTLRVHEDAVHPFINILTSQLGRRCVTEAVGALRVGLSV